MSNIRRLPVKRHDLDDLVMYIKEVVYRTAGAITVTEAIGALELAKLEILAEQKDE